MARSESLWRKPIRTPFASDTSTKSKTAPLRPRKTMRRALRNLPKSMVRGPVRVVAVRKPSAMTVFRSWQIAGVNGAQMALTTISVHRNARRGSARMINALPIVPNATAKHASSTPTRARRRAVAGETRGLHTSGTGGMVSPADTGQTRCAGRHRARRSGCGADSQRGRGVLMVVSPSRSTTVPSEAVSQVLAAAAMRKVSELARVTWAPERRFCVFGTSALGRCACTG
jgi:hypothetical protein